MSALRLLESEFKLKISYADCLGLFLAISSQFTLKVCTAAKNCEKIVKKLRKTLFWELKVVQGYR